MAKARILTDDESAILAEFFIDDEYIGQAIKYVQEAVTTYIVEEERKKLLIEVDATLAERVNEKVAIIV